MSRVERLFFDVTNAFTYRDNAIQVVTMASNMRLAGIETPSLPSSIADEPIASTEARSISRLGGEANQPFEASSTVERDRLFVLAGSRWSNDL